MHSLAVRLRYFVFLKVVPSVYLQVFMFIHDRGQQHEGTIWESANIR